MVLTERVLDSWYCQLEIKKAIELKKPIQILLDSDYRLGRPFGKWNWQEGDKFKKLDKKFAAKLLDLLEKEMPHAIIYRRREFEARAMMRALCSRRGIDAMNDITHTDLNLDLPTENVPTKTNIVFLEIMPK